MQTFGTLYICNWVTFQHAVKKSETNFQHIQCQRKIPKTVWPFAELFRVDKKKMGKRNPFYPVNGCCEVGKNMCINTHDLPNKSLGMPSNPPWLTPTMAFSQVGCFFMDLLMVILPWINDWPCVCVWWSPPTHFEFGMWWFNLSGQPTNETAVMHICTECLQSGVSELGVLYCMLCHFMHGHILHSHWVVPFPWALGHLRWGCMRFTLNVLRTVTPMRAGSLGWGPGSPLWDTKLDKAQKWLWRQMGTTLDVCITAQHPRSPQASKTISQSLVGTHLVFETCRDSNESITKIEFLAFSAKPDWHLIWVKIQESTLDIQSHFSISWAYAQVSFSVSQQHWSCSPTTWSWLIGEAFWDSISQALRSPRIVHILVIQTPHLFRRCWSRIWDPAPHNSTTFWQLRQPFLLIWHTQLCVLLIWQPVFMTLAAVELRGVPLFQHLRDPCPHNSTASCEYCDWPFNPTHLAQAGFCQIKRTPVSTSPCLISQFFHAMTLSN